VVAPASGGPLEIVEHGVTGFLYAAGDLDEAAHYVLRVIQDREEAKRLGAAGKQRYEEAFSLDAMVARTEAALAQVALRICDRA
jgi:phosphatidylinositol alpha 1,6-mannosyltransferase